MDKIHKDKGWVKYVGYWKSRNKLRAQTNRNVNHSIDIAENQKDLGVIIESKLSLDDHKANWTKQTEW